MARPSPLFNGADNALLYLNFIKTIIGADSNETALRDVLFYVLYIVLNP